MENGKSKSNSSKTDLSSVVKTLEKAKERLQAAEKTEALKKQIESLTETIEVLKK